MKISDILPKLPDPFEWEVSANFKQYRGTLFKILSKPEKQSGNHEMATLRK